MDMEEQEITNEGHCNQADNACNQVLYQMILYKTERENDLFILVGQHGRNLKFSLCYKKIKKNNN